MCRPHTHPVIPRIHKERPFIHRHVPPAIHHKQRVVPPCRRRAPYHKQGVNGHIGRACMHREQSPRRRSPHTKPRKRIHEVRPPRRCRRRIRLSQDEGVVIYDVFVDEVCRSIHRPEIPSVLGGAAQVSISTCGGVKSHPRIHAVGGVFIDFTIGCIRYPKIPTVLGDATRKIIPARREVKRHPRVGAVNVKFIDQIVR